jgi:hypothetical protein
MRKSAPDAPSPSGEIALYGRPRGPISRIATAIATELGNSGRYRQHREVVDRLESLENPHRMEGATTNDRDRFHSILPFISSLRNEALPDQRVAAVKFAPDCQHTTIWHG